MIAETTDLVAPTDPMIEIHVGRGVIGTTGILLTGEGVGAVQPLQTRLDRVHLDGNVSCVGGMMTDTGALEKVIATDRIQGREVALHVKGIQGLAVVTDTEGALFPVLDRQRGERIARTKTLRDVEKPGSHLLKFQTGCLGMSRTLWKTLSVLYPRKRLRSVLAGEGHTNPAQATLTLILPLTMTRLSMYNRTMMMFKQATGQTAGL